MGHTSRALSYDPKGLDHSLMETCTREGTHMRSTPVPFSKTDFFFSGFFQKQTNARMKPDVKG